MPDSIVADGDLMAPGDGFSVALFITVRDVAASRTFYAERLGGRVIRDANPCIIRLGNVVLIMNPGGGPTPDKPHITLAPYEGGDTVSSFMNLRVADIQARYDDWSARGVEFLTPPIDRGPEIRCYMKDPDGYLIEVGQVLPGRPAATKRPDDLPG